MTHLLYDSLRPIVTKAILCFVSPLSRSPSVQVVNGVQPMRHENGLSAKEDTAHFGDIIHLANHGNTTNGAREKSETSMATEPILTFQSEEPFMKKAGPMKPQHVAGTERPQYKPNLISNTLDQVS